MVTTVLVSSLVLPVLLLLTRLPPTVTAFHVVWDSSSLQKGSVGGTTTTGRLLQQQQQQQNQNSNNKRRPFSKSTTTNINPKHEQAKFPMNDTATAVAAVDEQIASVAANSVAAASVVGRLETAMSPTALPFLTPRATTPTLGPEPVLESGTAVAAATSSTTEAVVVVAEVALDSPPPPPLPTALQRAIANGAVKTETTAEEARSTNVKDKSIPTRLSTSNTKGTLPLSPPQFNRDRQRATTAKKKKTLNLEAMQRLARQPLDTEAVPVLTYKAQVVTAFDTLQQQQKRRARTSSSVSSTNNNNNNTIIRNDMVEPVTPVGVEAMMSATTTGTEDTDEIALDERTTAEAVDTNNLRSFAVSVTPRTINNSSTSSTVSTSDEATMESPPPVMNQRMTNDDDGDDTALTEQLKALATEVDALMTQVDSIVATTPVLESSVDAAADAATTLSMEPDRLDSDLTSTNDDDITTTTTNTVVQQSTMAMDLTAKSEALTLNNDDAVEVVNNNDNNNVVAVAAFQPTTTTMAMDDANRPKSETLPLEIADATVVMEVSDDSSVVDGFDSMSPLEGFGEQLDEQQQPATAAAETSNVMVPDSDRNEVTAQGDMNTGTMKGTESQSNESPPSKDAGVGTIIAAETFSETSIPTEEMTEARTVESEIINGIQNEQILLETSTIQSEDPSTLTTSIELDMETDIPDEVVLAKAEPSTLEGTALDITDEINTEIEMKERITDTIEAQSEMSPLDVPDTIVAVTEGTGEISEHIELPLVTEGDAPVFSSLQDPDGVIAPSFVTKETNESISMKGEPVLSSVTTQSDSSLSEVFRAAQASLLEKQQQQYSSDKTDVAVDVITPADTTEMVAEKPEAPIVVKTPEQLAQEADGALISLNLKQGVSEESIKGAALAAFVFSTLAGNGLPVSIFLTVPVTAYLSVCRGLTGEIIRTIGAVSWNVTLFCTEYASQFEFDPTTAATAMGTMTELWQNVQDSTRSVVATSSSWLAEQNGKAREYRDRDFVARINLEAERMRQPAERKAERDAAETSLFFVSKPDAISQSGQDANGDACESHDSRHHEDSEPPQRTIERLFVSSLQALRSVQESIYTVGVATSSWLQEQDANAREFRDRDFVAKIDLDVERMRPPRKQSVVAALDESDSGSTTVAESNSAPEAISSALVDDGASARTDFYFTTVAPVPGDEVVDA